MKFQRYLPATAITKALKSGVLKRGTAAGLAILTLSGALGLGSGFATAAENQDTASGESVLQGSWEVTVQPYICQTGAQVGLPFTSLLTFAKGGTVTEVSGTTSLLPGQGTTGLGVWAQTDDHQTFHAVSESLVLFDTTAPPYNLSTPLPPSVPKYHAGMQTLTQTINVDGNKLTDKSTTEFFDSTGAAYLQFCADAVGRRLLVDVPRK
jgi:hypothetical protein